MKRYILAVCGILFWSSYAGAQNIDSTIATYAAKYAPERCYLHYDKSAYVPGETIWFKSYLMKGIFPADESKTFYVDWTDDNGKLLLHTVGPIVDATSNGQFDIPLTYTGRFLHVKAYTKWMLNFDSAFLYEKDIRIFQKASSTVAAKNVVVPAITFFPEGGDMVAGLINKIAFKANDQWGRPIKIKGIIQSKAGVTVDTLEVLHDGMGSFLLNPAPGESYTAKWTDEKGAEHSNNLPAIKSSGISLQVTLYGNKRNFTVGATPDFASHGTVHLIGTMNQFEVFKITKDISAGTVRGIIPTKDLPSGILTITVFDDRWNALAERITYINNEEYLFHPEMNVEHWGLNKRARNEISISIPDSMWANLSVSVTDADIDADSSSTIISHFLLTGDIKGQVYNPAYYFSNTSDSISEQLDLVMLTHGWRRFKWDEVVAGKFPHFTFEKDTSYLSLSGKVYGALPSQIKESASIILIISQKKSEGNKLEVLPLSANGTFNDPTILLFDTAHVYYRLSKGLRDATVQFMEARLGSPRNHLAALGIYNNQPDDTSGSYRHNRLAAEAADLLKDFQGKEMENVIIKTKGKSTMQVMDEKYASGLFSGGDAYQFDMVNDPFAHSAIDIFSYLQGKVAGLDINTSNGTPSLKWRGGTPQIFVDEIATDPEMVSSIPVTDVAYIKIFRPPFVGAIGGGAGGAIAIYTRRGEDAQSTSKGLANNMVWGYTPLRQFFSPNYSNITPENEKRDVRSTLYWMPQVILTPQKNKVTISFYNNDVSRAFRVVIEGMNKDGLLAHLEQLME